jgi:hypothetical protein
LLRFVSDCRRALHPTPVHLVDARPEVFGVATERDFHLPQELVHALKQPLFATNACEKQTPQSEKRGKSDLRRRCGAVDARCALVHDNLIGHKKIERK